MGKSYFAFFFFLISCKERAEDMRGTSGKTGSKKLTIKQGKRKETFMTKHRLESQRSTLTAMSGPNP